MSPLIPNGSFILTCNWLPYFKGGKLVIKHCTYGLIVKSLIKRDQNGLLWCQGASTASVSVEQIGPVEKSKVLGTVLWTVKPHQQPDGQVS